MDTKLWEEAAPVTAHHPPFVAVGHGDLWRLPQPVVAPGPPASRSRFIKRRTAPGSSRKYGQHTGLFRFGTQIAVP